MTTEPKKRNAAKTTERILECAQEVFHEKGYDNASTREIAERADVNMALITRYFGSKKGLFEKAVLPFLSMDAALASGDELPLNQRLAQYFTSTTPKTRFDPVVVLLRSVSSEEVGPLLKDAIHESVILPLAKSMQGEDVLARATLIATQGAGLILWLRVLDSLSADHPSRKKMSQFLEEFFGMLIGE